MKLFRAAIASLLFATTSLFTIANAGLITLDQQSTDVDGGVINYTNLSADASTVSDAIFTLNISGDFDSGFENVLIIIDGYELGVVFDNDTTNDLFDFTNDDYLGNHDNYVNMTGVATIAQADWAAIIADGFVSIAFDLSSSVNCCAAGPHAFTSGNIAYDSTTVAAAAIPEPSTLAIFGLALIGFGVRRFNK